MNASTDPLQYNDTSQLQIRTLSDYDVSISTNTSTGLQLQMNSRNNPVAEFADNLATKNGPYKFRRGVETVAGSRERLTARTQMEENPYGPDDGLLKTSVTTATASPSWCCLG
jgi:hypothetical protein